MCYCSQASGGLQILQTALVMAACSLYSKQAPCCTALSSLDSVDCVTDLDAHMEQLEGMYNLLPASFRESHET